MLSIFNYPINRFGVRLAVISFSIGTLLFLLHFVIDAEIIAVIGLVYVVLALGINSFTFLFLLLHSLFTFKDIKEHSMAMLIMLMNLPIAYAYFSLLII